MELTAPNGHGIVVEAANSVSVEDVTVRKCVFHDITNKALVTRYPILLTSSGSARLNRITVQSCNIYDCGYGIAMGGLSREWAPNEFINPEQSYNKDYLIEDVHMNHLLYDGIIIMSVYGMVIRNCSLLNTCLLDDHPTAPMWSHHASNFIIENCEIAGAVNEKDGMAVDFDGWTTDAVYQYCYSHDNVRFIRNCCYDNYTCNDNCTVRYCLSVNDNQGDNSMAQLLSSSSLDYKPDEAAQYMTNFKFYNNTVVNASEFNLIGLKNAYIANNIFTGDLTTSFRFARKTFDGNGNKTVLRFDGTMKNNCFWGTSVPSIGTDNLVRNPRFVGTDETDPNSFKLADSSPLIGKGVFVCTDMGECDFYGNKLTKSLNIGCYGGEGEAAKTTVRPFGDLLALCNSVLGIIYNFIYTCNDLYWIF
ncbi:MAG TPA: hypothetical protein DDY98_06930 [Ruminococcaceae bacterium]|nr:hypothetical protein [Oscillospiraceae bacterium]